MTQEGTRVGGIMSHMAQAPEGELLRAGPGARIRFWGADPHSSQPLLSHPYIRKGFRDLQ